MNRVLLAAVVAVASNTAAAQRVDLNPTPREREILRQEILRAGFECPALNQVHGFGIGPRGAMVRAWCGPPGTRDLYSRLVYRLDLQSMPGGLTRVWVRIWEGNPHRVPDR